MLNSSTGRTGTSSAGLFDTPADRCLRHARDSTQTTGKTPSPTRPGKIRERLIVAGVLRHQDLSVGCATAWLVDSSDSSLASGRACWRGPRPARWRDTRCKAGWRHPLWPAFFAAQPDAIERAGPVAPRGG
jgi:hypothetical protein